MVVVLSLLHFDFFCPSTSFFLPFIYCYCCCCFLLCFVLVPFRFLFCSVDGFFFKLSYFWNKSFVENDELVVQSCETNIGITAASNLMINISNRVRKKMTSTSSGLFFFFFFFFCCPHSLTA